MSTEITKSNRSFYAIVEDLAVWQETLEFIEAQINCDPKAKGYANDDELAQQRAKILAKREGIGLELIAKVDGIAAVDRRFDAEIALADEAAKSATKHRKALETAKEWLRDYVLNVMEQRGMKHLKTPLTTVTVQGNGGVAPVVIEDLSRIPYEHCWLVGRIKGDLFRDLVRRADVYDEDLLITAEWRFAKEPNTAAISKALQEPCPNCAGCRTLEVPGGNPLDCPECHGSGKAKVPGARLADRGKHLRIT